MKLALGTAQFGLNYGIANSTGQVSQEQIGHILDQARLAGIDIIDTSKSYGDSESRLGIAGVSEFNIITKLPTVPDDDRDLTIWVENHIKDSLTSLNTDRLYSVLLHDSSQLGNEASLSAFRILQQFKAEGLIQKIGISIYSPDILDEILLDYPADIVQAPLNLVDRRLLESGWLSRLSDAGVEVHVRSAFLQGVLLMDREKMPSYFYRWNSLWSQWEKCLEQTNLPAASICLRFLLELKEVSKIIVGVDTSDQLRELIDCVSIANETSGNFPQIASSDEALVNPFCWDIH